MTAPILQRNVGAVTLELVSSFDKIIADLGTRLSRPYAELEPDILSGLSTQTVVIDKKEIKSLTVSSLFILAVCENFFQTLKQADSSAGLQLSPAQPNSYKLVDHWGECLAVKAQLAQLVHDGGKGSQVGSSFISARTGAFLIGIMELLLHLWRDLSTLTVLSGRDQELFQSARTLLLDMGSTQSKHAIQRHLSSI